MRCRRTELCRRAAIVSQAHYRGKLARSNYRGIGSSTRFLQRLVRGQLSRRKSAPRKAAAALLLGAARDDDGPGTDLTVPPTVADERRQLNEADRRFKALAARCKSLHERLSSKERASIRPDDFKGVIAAAYEKARLARPEGEDLDVSAESLMKHFIRELNTVCEAGPPVAAASAPGNLGA